MKLFGKRVYLAQIILLAVIYRTRGICFFQKSEKRKKRKAVIEQLSDQEKVSENVETEIVLGYIKTVRVYTFNILRNHNFV